ncbi:MAG TPA: cytochrome c [Vicinamibacterales bacterium]|nr:cytochrome c [Vicinamibacterales bacterium]
MAIRNHVWALVVPAVLGGTSLLAQQPAKAPAAEVTPVSGVSTLHHLHRAIEGSTMGWDGQWSSPPSAVAASRSTKVGDDFVLSGADLYRISCRACHKPDGSGAPPEINSILGPVQAASAPWMTERMKAMGRPVDRSFIRDLTSNTEADLRKRLKTGGHDMPSFGHLSEAEIAVLRPYLDQLAGLPASEKRQRSLAEPAARVGELIVKGTCHICHDATAFTTAPTTVLSGVIPPLGSMPRQKTFSDFVRKVSVGMPIPLGTPGVSSRGRMPVFSYLSEEEAGAAYSYLSLYPPR